MALSDFTGQWQVDSSNTDIATNGGKLTISSAVTFSAESMGDNNGSWSNVTGSYYANDDKITGSIDNGVDGESFTMTIDNSGHLTVEVKRPHKTDEDAGSFQAHSVGFP